MLVQTDAKRSKGFRTKDHLKASATSGFDSKKSCAVECPEPLQKDALPHSIDEPAHLGT